MISANASQNNPRATQWKSSSASPLEGMTVGLGAFILLFQTTDYGLALSLIALLLFAAAGIRAALAHTAMSSGITYFEIVMASTVLASGLAYYYMGNIYSAQYTVLFAMTATSASFIARGYSPKALFKWAAISHLMMILVASAFNFSDLISGLDAGAANRWSLRFKPFGLHPNLTGFIFAGGFVFLAYGAATNRGWKRLAFLGGCLASVSAVLAASARGGLLALFVSSIIMGFVYWRRIFASRPKMAIIVCVLLMMIIALSWSHIVDYLFVILELDSKNRGLNSGGTGRVARWITSLDIIQNGRTRLFIGTGLRTVGVETFGFVSTENSYLNIAIESGLFIFAATVVLFFGGAYRLYSRSKIDPDPIWMFMTWLLIYSCLQSIVNRYLLGIGNSVSFYVFLTAAMAWLPRRIEPTVKRVRQLMPWQAKAIL